MSYVLDKYPTQRTSLALSVIFHHGNYDSDQNHIYGDVVPVVKYPSTFLSSLRNSAIRFGVLRKPVKIMSFDIRGPRPNPFKDSYNYKVSVKTSICSKLQVLSAIGFPRSRCASQTGSTCQIAKDVQIRYRCL